VYIFFPGYVADNAVCVRQLLSDLFHSVPTARDERYSCAAIQQLADESQPKAGSPASDSHSKIDEWIARMTFWRR
jgi:hypothetical protein